jgi:hypothetical protein
MASSILNQFEAMSLNSVVAGFSFASALAWMDAVRWFITHTIKVSGSGGKYYLLSAMFTTFLAIVIFMVLSRVAKNVAIKEPQSAMYAVTR